MDVSISRKSAMRVAFTRATGPYRQSAVEAWKKMMAWAGPRRLFTPETKFIGIGHDDPSTTAPERIRYDACITVGTDVEADGEAGVMEIPSGEYATVIHKGPYDQAIKTYKWFFGEWLPKSGREASMRPGYEVYLNDPQTTPSEALLTEINIPLEEK